MTEFAVGLLWAAAVWRLIMTTARGWKRGRAELTVASLCLAVLVTNFLWRPQVDHLVGEPNVAGLIGRISAVVGLTAFHWVLVTPGRRGRLLSGMFAVVSGAAMAWSWQVAPLHVQGGDRVLRPGAHVPVGGRLQRGVLLLRHGEPGAGGGRGGSSASAGRRGR